MRTHADIVRQFGAMNLARELKRLGTDLATSTTQRWADRDRIPAEYWEHLIELGAASRDELLASQRPRKRPDAQAAAA